MLVHMLSCEFMSPIRSCRDNSTIVLIEYVCMKITARFQDFDNNVEEMNSRLLEHTNVGFRSDAASHQNS